MNAFSSLSCLALALSFASAAFATESPCTRCASRPAPRAVQVCYADDEEQPSWMFRRSTYSHDPYTGARVAQYQRLPAIQPLDDERMVTSRYHRTQTNLRGTNGSNESYYEVQQWGNGRGGIDAEWERFHNAWKESYLQNGYFNQGPGFGNGFPGQFGFNGFGPGFGFGNPWYGNGFPGIGNGGPFWRNNGQWSNGNGHGHHGDGAQFNDHGHAGDWN
jgi:hypothetical protein